MPFDDYFFMNIIPPYRVCYSVKAKDVISNQLVMRL